MATHRLDKNRDTQWSVTASGDTWIVGAGRRIDVENQYGISENGHSGSRIAVNGRVRVEGAGYAGILVEGSDTRLTVGRQGRIEADGADAAIRLAAAGAEVVNRGIVTGSSLAVQGTIWGTVVNHGTMEGYDGISFGGPGGIIENHGTLSAHGSAVLAKSEGFSLVNARGGLVENEAAACIYLDGAGEAEIVNRGVIRADGGTAIACVGELTLVNRGRIVGNVHFANGDNVADLRRGQVDGQVFGGSGDDTFRVSSSGIAIVEDAADGLDRVFSSATITLAANIEWLYLRGRRDIDGTGNADGNHIAGNAGNNILKGEAGQDVLVGGGGRDQLFGGGDADVFIFETGYGRDVIRDFEDGTDLIGAEAIQSENDFNVAKFLHMDQVGSDIVIDFGAGDRLVIRDMALADLSYADFVQ